LFALPTDTLVGQGDEAMAQSPCASPYVVQPGDTLYRITQQCRVRLEALKEANPRLGDKRRIAVGTRIRIPNGSDETAAGEPPDEAAADGIYTVRRGDTMFSIAQGEGVSLNALMAANPGVDPSDMAIGLTLTLPGGSPGVPDDDEGVADRATISVQPLAGAPGTPVTVRGDNYRPGSSVTIGWGPPQSKWERLDRAEVAADGSVRSHVVIPRFVEPGREIVFVIDNGAGVTRVSERVDVVDERDPDEPREGENDAITVEGRIGEGTECPLLTTSEGRLYSFAGAENYSIGEYVRVTGTMADMSFCMQGEDTIDVDTMTEIPSPDDRSGMSLTREYVIASWAAEGSDCGRPDFAITGNAAGGQVVETSLEGVPRTGYVQLGRDPAFIFDRPRRELPLERRGPDGLAVLPPVTGPVTLGGVEIEGDGNVFVRCPA
jgi:LysM repeat protein